MTDKQRLFVEAYLGRARLNATKAARMAGYADPEKEGWRLRQHPEVSAEIAGRVAEYAMSADEVLSRLAEQARSSISDFVEADHWGGKPTVSFSPATLRKKGHLVKSFKSGKSGVSIEMYDAQAALVQLGKAQGLFTEKSQVDMNVGGELRVVVEYVDAGAAAGAEAEADDEGEGDTGAGGE